MSTLVRKTPRSEYLDGIRYLKDKNSGLFDSGVPFQYRNLTDDEIAEYQPLKGFQLDKKTNIIYTSSPENFEGSCEVLLEDQSRKRIVTKVQFDRKNNKKTDMRLKNVKDKYSYLGKILILE